MRSLLSRAPNPWLTLLQQLVEVGCNLAHIGDIAPVIVEEPELGTQL